MGMNEAETKYFLIDPVLRTKGYTDISRIKLETPAPVEPVGFKGRRKRGPGRTDYLLCVQVMNMPKPLPVAVLEAKSEEEDPLKGMQQAKSYANCKRFDAKYVFASNGHLYGEFDFFSGMQNGPFPFVDFPTHQELTERYVCDTNIDLNAPDSEILFMPDSPGWSQTRYYQDAAIRAAFEKILKCWRNGDPPRVLLSLATGSGKTIVATNLLWRMHEAGQLPKPALFVCDRDELREQAYTKLRVAFGDNVRIVKQERGVNVARNARIHIATYQTLGLDDDTLNEELASFLTEFYPENSFSVIIIDECHRSAWGRWSEVLKRNPDAVHIGLTATPRQLYESKDATPEDSEITANNLKYFGNPVYEYTLVEAQEDGYLAACEIVKRKASIDSTVFTRQQILYSKAVNIKTNRLLTEADLAKEKYTGKDFDDELFIELRTPAMCADLFEQLCLNGGPEQKVIIFCTREIHADRVVMQMNNLYMTWCRKNKIAPKDHYAFKCMGGANNGSEMIEPMRGSGERAFIACTVDLLEAGVDIERLNAVVFFRYVKSSIKFYQMLGRGTRIHEETGKYKFWLYDYSDVTELFGTDFISRPSKPGKWHGQEGDGGDGEESDLPVIGEMKGHLVLVTPKGNFILCNRNGKEVPVPVDEYRGEIIHRILQEAHSIEEFRQLWVETNKRKELIHHLAGAGFLPEVIREHDQMTDYDLYDFFGFYGYHATAWKKQERGGLYLRNNETWFQEMDEQAAIVLMELGRQFAAGGTEALEKPAFWDVPAIRAAGGLEALKKLGRPYNVLLKAKGKLFAA
jgi:type I restriction enzyme R subunit